jgi:hypothetical protein
MGSTPHSSTEALADEVSRTISRASPTARELTCPMRPVARSARYLKWSASGQTTERGG